MVNNRVTYPNFQNNVHVPAFCLNQILFLGPNPDSDQVPGSSYLPPENGSEIGDEEEYIFYPPGTWNEKPL